MHLLLVLPRRQCRPRRPRVPATGAAAQEPLDHAAGHHRRLGRVRVQELLVPRGPPRWRHQRLRWMLRPAAQTGKAAAGLVARDDGALSYSVDGVLLARPNDIVHIGLDLGAGSPSGTFAARGPPCSPRPSTPARRSVASSPLLDHVSDFASISFSLPAHTSTQLHALDSDCRIMWAAAVTHKKFAARCGLPQIALIMRAAVADAGRAVHRRPICILNDNGAFIRRTCGGSLPRRRR
jgi:hypothetical protein